jgi:hypothetical protein
MNDHTLDALKGWPSPYAVDHVASAASGVTVTAGNVVTLDASGNYVLGFTAATLQGVAMFAFQNSSDPDVANDGGLTSTAAGSANAWVPVAPVGGIMALVATGAYELESTEFDAAFAPAIGSTMSADTDGELIAGTAYTHSLCGVVSAAKSDNSHGVSSIKFFPVYLPKTP